MKRVTNIFTVLEKLKECVGFFFFNNLIATNGKRLCDGWTSEYECSALAQKPNSSKNVQ